MRRVYAAKVTCLTPGDLSVCHELLPWRQVGMDRQESAEAIVAAAPAVKGRTAGSRRDAARSMQGQGGETKG